MPGLPAALPGQIRYLLQSLNGSNSDSVFQDLCQYVEYGTEGGILVLKSFLQYLNVYEKVLKKESLDPVFCSTFKYVIEKPNFNTILCQSLKDEAINEDFLENLSKAIGLSISEKIGVGLALSDSGNQDHLLCGNKFCIAQIAELCVENVSLCSAEQIQSIFMFLQRSEGFSKHFDSFMQLLSLVQFKKEDQFILTPLMSQELGGKFSRNLDLFDEDHENDFDTLLAEMKKEMSMADIMKELGYECTVNVSQCKEMLSLFLPLTEVTVSRILGTVICTNTGLDDQLNIFPTFCSALGSTTSSDQTVLNSWNIDVLIDSIRQLAPRISWPAVIENLDHEEFCIPNETAFSFFISIYRHACQDPFPLHAICGSLWRNTEGQLSFLKYAVVSPHELFTFAHSGRQLAYADAFQGHKLPLGPTNHAWICLDLLQTLCQLAEVGHANAVRSILKLPLEQCPEVLLLGMAHINTTYNLIQHEVSSAVLPVILNHSAGLGMVLHMWHANPSALLRGFLDVYNVNPAIMSRIFDICQELKITSPVLDMVPFSFGIRLAVLASHKDLLDMEKWIKSNVTTYTDPLFEECIRFIKDQFSSYQDISAGNSDQSLSLCNIYSEAAPAIFKVLQDQLGLNVTVLLSEEMEMWITSSTHATSRLNNSAPSNLSSTDGFGDDVEIEANNFFHKIFSAQLSIESMIQTLARFKDSSDKREQAVFDCMIGNLFEEYKFFHKYPETQLIVAAHLFGNLIKHQLVSHLTLGIALRAVLDALRRPADSKMFVFGVRALDQFVDRLVEWPLYCNHILQISHLRTTHYELVAFIERALARISSGNVDSGGVIPIGQHGSFHSTAAPAEMPSSSIRLVGSASTQSALQISSSLQLQQRDQIPLDESQKLSLTSSNVKSLIPHPSPVPSCDATSQMNVTTGATIVSSSVGFTRPSRAIASARFGSALNIETLVAAAERRETPLEVPASEIQDKISFIINNLSAANFESKAKEFTEILKDQYYPWFAQYMVMKRASIEPNFHDLYLKFLEKVSSPSLNAEVLKATYENCKVLLGSELIKSSSEERSLLKNLGSWLGKFTIGRNKALRACHIDPKSLIIEAYEKGLMIAVIPFTSKVLEPCQNSAAYQPPNPYTMGILKLLAEIYAMPNLKMNLKFDIEVLFKNLSVDLKGVTPASLLKDRVRQIEGNPDFSTKDVGAQQHSIMGEVKSNAVSALNQVELPLEVATPAHPGGHSHMLSQFAAPPLHLPSGVLMEDEKLAALGMPDQLSSAQGLVPRQSSFSVNQLSTPTSNIEQQVIVNPKLHSLGLYLHFQSVVPHAMDRAIKEIVSGIVQRSVSIATQTTKELVLKDYAMEYDENRIRSAAHLMVASLAGSLAHVTCKEPLRGSISSQLRSTLQGSSIGNDLLEQAVQLVTNDNLDLGCALIEQAATEKAIQTIDGEIAQQLAIRRKHRDGVGSAFYDSGLYTQGHAGVMPEALRPKPGRLSHYQQRVYEDFVKLPWQNQSSHNSNSQPVGSSVPSSSVAMSKLYNSVSGQLNPGTYSSGLANSGISSLVQPLDLTSEEMDSSAVQLHSVANIVSSDGVNQSDFDSDSAVTSFPSASASELHPLELPTVMKESGAPLQILSSSPATPVSDRVVSSASEQLLTTGDALEKYQIISEKLEDMAINDATEADIQGIIGEVPGIILRCVSRDEAALAVAQKVFKGLYDNASNSARVATHLAILAAIRDVSKLVVKELTSWVIYSDEDRKLNKDITVGLIRSELLNLAEYNLHMAKLLDAGRNKAATEFAISLIQTLVHSDPRIISELHNLVDVLAKLAARPGSPESLQQLVEVARNPSANSGSISTFGKEDTAKQFSRDKKAQVTANKEDYSISELSEPDPAGFRDQASMFFAEWYKICELPVVNDAISSHYVLQLSQSGLLKGDDMSDRFFRCLTEISVSHCLSSSETMSSSPLQSQQVQPLSFLAIDIYAKLIFSILKFCPVDQGSNNKFYLLPKILSVTVRIIHKDAEEKKSSFNPRPYFRLFINWLLDLCSMDPALDGANLQVLTAFANTFHALQPLKVPGFSFAWLELISQRSFLPKLLTGNAQKGWPYMQRLLVDLFQFLEPFLRTAELGDPVHALYKGTLRVLLVLLHDYPEFLCDYHFSFCDVIPSSCIQMRNIILSAFPRNMRLPDPSTPNLKIDLLAEISQSPRILSEVDAALKAKQMKAEVDEYLKIRQQGSTFLSDLKQKLLLPANEVLRSGTRYNVPLINSLVLYVGMQAIQQLQARSPPHTQAIPSSAPLAVFLVGAALDIFQMLMMDLDTEGRYLFLNVVANQLRYPNNHTHYFSFILLYLFNESNQETIQEQITRVLLERLIVNRPHPWGLLITFIELIKNPRYNFWSKSFTRCAPEIEKLFESVSRSCGGPKPADDSLGAGGISDPMH